MDYNLIECLVSNHCQHNDGLKCLLLVQRRYKYYSQKSLSFKNRIFVSDVEKMLWYLVIYATSLKTALGLWIVKKVENNVSEKFFEVNTQENFIKIFERESPDKNLKKFTLSIYSVRWTKKF